MRTVSRQARVDDRQVQECWLHVCWRRWEVRMALVRHGRLRLLLAVHTHNDNRKVSTGAPASALHFT
jgi:hypothetical protein